MQKKLYRSKSDKKVSGICGGLGAYLDIDPTIIRLCAVGFTFFFCGLGIFAYLVGLILIPEEPS
jgi:phage shock protein PspC (stress-responsive transcriptional regulator)